MGKKIGDVQQFVYNLILKPSFLKLNPLNPKILKSSFLKLNLRDLRNPRELILKSLFLKLNLRKLFSVTSVASVAKYSS